MHLFLDQSTVHPNKPIDKPLTKFHETDHLILIQMQAALSVGLEGFLNGLTGDEVPAKTAGQYPEA